MVVEGGESRRWAGLLALVVLVVLAGCVDYPPRPTICISCYEGIEAATGDSGDPDDRSNLSVTHSELTIRVRDDTTARWTVRSNLSGPEVRELRSDPDAVDRLADRAVTRKVGTLSPYVAIHGGNVSNQSARLQGTTLIISFTTENAAKQTVGDIHVVDYFNTKGDPPASYQLGTDRMVIRGPSRTVVTKRPSGATLTQDDRGLVWTGRETRITTDTYLAFGPDRRATTRSLTDAAISVDVMRWGLPRAVPAGAVFGLLVAGLLVGLTRRVDQPPTLAAEWGGSLKARLVNVSDVLAVGIGLVVAVVAVSYRSHGGGIGSVVGVIVTSPLVAGALFGVYGYTLRIEHRASRSVLLAVVGLAITYAFHEVTTVPDWPLSTNPTMDIVVWSVFVTIVGIPLFFVGYSYLPPPARSSR